MENKTKPSIYQQPNFDLSHMNLNSNSSFAFFYYSPFLMPLLKIHISNLDLVCSHTCQPPKPAQTLLKPEWIIGILRFNTNKGGGEIILTRGEQG